METNFSYTFQENTPEFRFAGLVYSVPAQKFDTFRDFGITPARLECGVFFSIKCSLAECGRYILKRVCEICVTVSGFIRRAVRVLRRSFSRIFRQKFSEQTTYLSCCVLRC